MRIGTGLSAVALLAAMVTPAQAQPFEESIPLDLARVLVSPGTMADITFHRGFPPDFPDIELPSGTSVMGSMGGIGGVGRQGGERVVLHAPPDAGRQREQLVAFMEEQGYRMLTRPPRRNQNQRGFIAPDVIPPGMAVQLCHDDHGMVSVQVVRGSAEPLLVMMRGVMDPRQVAQMSCAQHQARMERMGGPGPGGGAQQYMPRLELPPGATSSGRGVFAPFGISGSLDHARTSTDLSLDWAPARLHEHFAAQLREQGWAVDSEGSGERSASSIWLGEEDDRALTGALQIMPTGEAQYRVAFMLAVAQE